MSLIAPGVEAPDFALKDQNNQLVRLSDLRGRKAVLLVFYPAAFTGVCQDELGQIQDNLSEFSTADTQVLTISVDSVYSHKVWSVREGFGFPLLADFWPHGEVARAYGVFAEDRGVAERGTYVIDKAGVITRAELNPPGHPRHPAPWLAALLDLGTKRSQGQPFRTKIQ